MNIIAKRSVCLELRTYALKPSQFGNYIKLSNEKFHLRKKFGKFYWYFRSDFCSIFMEDTRMLGFWVLLSGHVGSVWLVEKWTERFHSEFTYLRNFFKYDCNYTPGILNRGIPYGYICKLHKRTAHSKLNGFWIHDLGGLNAVTHLWVSTKSSIREIWCCLGP